MPFALVTIGMLLVITGARDTYGALGTQLAKDFTGQGNFTWWVVAILGVGAVGYVPALRPISQGFLVLIIIAIFLSHKGFFAQFQQALQQGPKESAPSPLASAEPSIDIQTSQAPPSSGQQFAQIGAQLGSDAAMAAFAA